MGRWPLLALTPVLAGAAALALGRYLYAIAASPERATRIAVGFDQLANVATNGNEDETISSRADRARAEGRRWGCFLCGVLDRIHTHHCEKSRGV